MMSQNEKQQQQILTVYNQHGARFPHGPVTHGGPGGSLQYVSYFVGQSGDQWIFQFDPVDGATLMGGDVAWDVYPVADDDEPACALLLDAAEELWLAACWEVAKLLRHSLEAVGETRGESA
jgi:hypothetical protein